MEVAVTGKAKLKLAWASLLFRSNVSAMENCRVVTSFDLKKNLLVEWGLMRNK